MPCARRRRKAGAAGTTAIPDELVDQLLKGYSKPEDLLGPGGLIKQLMACLIRRATDAELTDHLGYERPHAG